MLNRNPQTYHEIVSVKNVLELAKYYEVSEEFLDEAYDFISASKENTIVADINYIFFKKNNIITKQFTANLKTSSIDGLTITSTLLTVIPHYTPSSGSYSGGSSSNNNNKFFIQLL